MLTFMYANAPKNIMAAGLDWLSHDVRVMLLAAAHTPALDTHDFLDDVVANEVTGTGYTAAGQALGTKASTVTAANAFSTVWAATTAYIKDYVVRPTAGNGFLYVVQQAGTSAGSQPTWPTTLGGTVTDGTVVWVCAGRSITQFSAADLAWATSTISARYAVVYNRNPATNATRPLVILIDFEGTQSTAGTTFQVNWPTMNGLKTVFYTIQ